MWCYEQVNSYIVTYGDKLMRTPLFHEHVKLNARIVDFHGWEMPVWYTGIVEEHMAVRNSAGVFDACHMGEIYVRGEGAEAFLNKVLTRDIPSMPKNKVFYGFFLNKSGGIIDDLTIYCIEPSESYMLCVNASNKDLDLKWLNDQSTEAAIIEDESSATSLIALQGPDSCRILKTCLDFDIDSLKKYTFAMHETSRYGAIMISKTGYTGAGGVEIFLNASHAPDLWSSLIEHGARPCGLGARDTLRLEMGYPLHGNDIDEAHTPLEAGLTFALDMEKQEFLGKDALEEQIRTGLTRHLRGLVLKDKGIPRQGCVCMKHGREVGTVTSGSISPVLNSGIALAYLDKTIHEQDEVEIVVRSKTLKATVVHPPFVSGTL